MSTLSFGSIPLPAGRGNPGLSRVRTLFQSIGTEWRARRAARHVAGLSDEMLRDIGLSRAEIDQAVRCGRGRAG